MRGFHEVEGTEGCGILSVMPMDFPSVPGTNRRWQWGAVAAAALVLVSAVFLYFFRHSTVPDRPRLAVESQAQILQQMALVQEPPAFVPSPAGAGEADRAGEKFQQGMREYSTGSYPEAILRLEEALQVDPENMAATFYLGVCLLMSDQPDKAIAQLSKLATAENSYTHESHWYSAKAYFRKSDLGAARRELEATVASGGMHAPEARKALEKIDVLR